MRAPDPHACMQWEKDHFRSNFDIKAGPIGVEWFRGGRTNLSFNCLDRWVASGCGDAPCFLWEGNDIGQERTMTYADVLTEVCRLVRSTRLTQ